MLLVVGREDFRAHILGLWAILGVHVVINILGLWALLFLNFQTGTHTQKTSTDTQHKLQDMTKAQIAAVI